MFPNLIEIKINFGRFFKRDVMLCVVLIYVLETGIIWEGEGV